MSPWVLATLKLFRVQTDWSSWTTLIATEKIRARSVWSSLTKPLRMSWVLVYFSYYPQHLTICVVWLFALTVFGPTLTLCNNLRSIWRSCQTESCMVALNIKDSLWSLMSTIDLIWDWKTMSNNWWAVSFIHHQMRHSNQLHVFRFHEGTQPPCRGYQNIRLFFRQIQEFF